MNGGGAARTIVRGIWRVLQGRPDGIEAFEGTPEALLRSLTPWIALATAGALVSAGGPGGLPGALTDFCLTLDVLLLPLVLTQALMARYGRGRYWLRYAVAVNWCNWALPAAFFAATIAADALGALGVPLVAAVAAALGAVSLFGLWIHIVLARYGLSLTLGRAVTLVIVTECATGCLLLLRLYLGGGVPA